MKKKMPLRFICSRNKLTTKERKVDHHKETQSKKLQIITSF